MDVTPFDYTAAYGWAMIALAVATLITTHIALNRKR